MVQTIATLIDETLMVMGAHLHVRMTDEEKAYLDAHFELIHIKKGEHLVTRGEEVCYLYYLESGIVRLWFPDKENREISARFIQAHCSAQIKKPKRSVCRQSSHADPVCESDSVPDNTVLS